MNTVDLLKQGLERVKSSWFRGNTTGLLMAAVLSNGTVIVEGDATPLPGSCYCLGTSVNHDQVSADFIRRAAGLPIPARDKTGYAPAEDIWKFNDSLPADATGRARVIAVMEKAIELAEADSNAEEAK